MRSKRIGIDLSDMENPFPKKPDFNGQPAGNDTNSFIENVILKNENEWSLSKLPGFDLPIEYSLELLGTGSAILIVNNLLFSSSRISTLGTIFIIPGSYLLAAKGLNFLSLNPEERAIALGDQLQNDFLDTIGATKTPEEKDKCPNIISGWLGPIPIFGAWSIGRNLFCRATGSGKT
jgi:hypothetical protein